MQKKISWSFLRNPFISFWVLKDHHLVRQSSTINYIYIFISLLKVLHRRLRDYRTADHRFQLFHWPQKASLKTFIKPKQIFIDLAQKKKILFLYILFLRLKSLLTDTCAEIKFVRVNVDGMVREIIKEMNNFFYTFFGCGVKKKIILVSLSSSLGPIKKDTSNLLTGKSSCHAKSELSKPGTP